MHCVKLAAIAAVIVSAAAPAPAQDRREAGAHRHGHGKLDIAIDGDKAGFDLRAPGADIIDFEHAASTEKEKATLKAAKEILANPLKIVTLPEAAGCVVEQSFVHYTKDPEHAAHHEKKHGGGHHGEKHHGGHHDGHPGHQEGHAEFHAGYQFTCLAPEKLSTLTLGYFDQFQNALSLQVSIATAKGQTQFDATRDRTAIDFDASM
ncbi:MAG: DUF2796 domain-containing protein [Alphaproteobacteria bacterium]|nr:DUF2796 domain-containing protein [Alphaproteobacteria bacterium]